MSLCARAASRRCLGWDAGTGSRCLLLSHFLYGEGVAHVQGKRLRFNPAGPLTCVPRGRQAPAPTPRWSPDPAPPRRARRRRRYLGDHVLAGQQQGAQQVLPAVVPQGVDGHLGRGGGSSGRGRCRWRPTPADRAPPARARPPLLPPDPRAPCRVPASPHAAGSTRRPGTRRCPAQLPGPQGSEALLSCCPSQCLGGAGRGEPGDRRCEGGQGASGGASECWVTDLSRCPSGD